MGQETELLTYPVTPDWKARVRAELDVRGRGAHAEMARAIGISTGQLTELLSPASRYSQQVASIHEFLGWTPPQPPVPGSSETSTIRYLIERATPEQRRYMLDTANMLMRAPNTEATLALTAMLRAFRSGFDPRREFGAIVRVLVVDPDERSMRAIEQSVSPVRDKVQLLMTDNALDAGLLIGSQRPQLVVVDEALGGIELCTRVRAMPDAGGTVLAIMASKPSKALAQAASKAGALRVVHKPVDMIALLAEITAG